MHVVHSRKKKCKMFITANFIHTQIGSSSQNTWTHIYPSAPPSPPPIFSFLSISHYFVLVSTSSFFPCAFLSHIFFLFYFAIRLILFGVVALQFLFFRWTVWHNLDVSFHIIFNFFPYSPAAPSIGSSIHFCYLLYFCWCCLSVHCFGLLCSTRLCSMLHAPCFYSCELANGANLRFNGTSTEINCNNT